MGKIRLHGVLIAGLLLISQAAFADGARKSSVHEEGADVFHQAETLLIARRFDELERLASRYRAHRSKVTGGNSALFYLYAGLGTPSLRNELTDSVPLATKRELLETWLARDPQSLTVKVALAAHWNAVAWQKRGTAKGDETSDAQFAGFAESLVTAKRHLQGIKAASDPEIYYLLIQIVMGTSGSRAELDKLYKRATGTYPDFFHYYSQRANTLEEKWYGAPGDLQKLAQSVLIRPGNETGRIAYSYIAARLAECNCHDVFHELGLSWTEVKAGYEARRVRYGLRNRDWNTLTLLAATAGAPADAEEALGHVGDWDPAVWSTRENFEAAVKWVHTVKRTKPDDAPPGAHREP